MRRYINLVNPALLPPKPFFQFRSMMLALAVLAGGMLLLALFMASRLFAYEQAAVEVNGRLASKQAQVKAQETTQTQRQKSPKLVADLATQQAEHEDLLRIDQALQFGGLQGKDAVASAYLYALASQPLPGVWLNSIKVHGEHVSLQGMAMNADAIPATLALLNKLPAFQGQHFAAFEVGRKQLTAVSDSAKSVEVLTFLLDSGAAKEAKP